MKFWNSEFSSVHTLNFQNFKISHFWNCEFFLVCLIGYYHFILFYHQLNSILWILWKSFVSLFFLLRKFLTFKTFNKSKHKLESNRFLIWVSWCSCVLKRNNVSWLPWFQMTKNINIYFSFFWQFDIWHHLWFLWLCFDHVECDSQCKSWNRLPKDGY